MYYYLMFIGIVLFIFLILFARMLKPLSVETKQVLVWNDGAIVFVIDAAEHPMQVLTFPEKNLIGYMNINTDGILTVWDIHKRRVDFIDISTVGEICETLKTISITPKTAL